MKAIVLIVVSFIGCLTTMAQNQTTSEQLDSFFQVVKAYDQINGNVLVAEKGEIFYRHSFGYADFARQLPNVADSRFTLGSVAKVFTSVAVLQLRDQGKLRLDDPLIKYFPEFPYPTVSIRHLLSHTSGLPDYELFGNLIKTKPEQIISIRDIIPALKNWPQGLYFQPGDKWQYSNNNYGLLALLVERLSRQNFQTYLQQYIFDPAGMKDTYFLLDTTEVRDDKRVINHDFPKWYSAERQDVMQNDKFRWRLYNLSGFVGQGNIITSTDDLLKFDQALYGHMLVPATTLNQAFTPTQLNNGEPNQIDIGIGKSAYGLGWFIFEDTTQGKVVGHTGGVPGGLSIFLRNIDRKQTVILLDNAFSEGLYQNGVNALRILNDQPILIRKRSLTQAYGSSLVEKGIDPAFCHLLQLRSDTAHYYLNEEQMNLLGYQLFYEAAFEGHQQLALEVFKINTLLFPKSYNTYDSYGEGLWKSGKLKEAVVMYKKSLEVNPENEEGKAALEQILPLLK